jgi:CRP-like cAMP-binding protein
MNLRDAGTARRSNLLAGMPPDIAREVIAQSQVRAFGRGETVFLHGEPARCIAVVLEGWVKLARIAPNGAEAVVAVFTEGQSFGEAVALQGSTYPVTAEAVTECRLLLVRAGLVLDLVQARPEALRALLAAMYRHFHALVGQIEALKAQTGVQRVAEFLIGLCPVADGACTVTLPYDKILIAGRLGMKPESLSRTFARLRESGVRVSQNRATIADVARLRAVAEEDPAIAWSRAL